MAIHHREPHVWTTHEQAVLKEVTERSWAHIERVRSEAEFHRTELRFREELEARVAERTEAAKRAEEALQHSRKLEAIGNLTGGVAHDFNNLLTPIAASLELLRKRIPQEESLLRLVDRALEGAKRGASLTSRMLAFARKQELKVERVSMGDLVLGMTELMNRSLGAARLRVKIEPYLPPVAADAGQLESALLNLVLNARDAMDGQGEIQVEVQRAEVLRDRSTLSAGTYVCLSVTDTGHGMDAETLRRALEPFFTTKGVGKGTGLGLPMVQGFAEQSGGTLSIESGVGQGTRAKIFLPAAEPASAPETVLLQNEIPTHHEAATILAVDDDPLVLATAVDMLTDLGLNVVTATSGAEALALLESRTFDLVLTDHAMPHMTGAQLIQKIKLHSPDLPVILATGYAELPFELSNFVRLGKPYSLAELSRAIGSTRVALTK